ncbi:helix-turn-helix domain-containing protein, partial [Candidatus Dojkabacteria bacterium]|nr:helix-turn-helix domain-containing protein [Candidatus Dojkabacteria bacterium]
RSLFTGQQQVIYDYLSKYAGEIVSKEDIAQVVWGADWEEKYSAQTLDKQISNIRKQLSVSDLKQEIITLRDQGYILKSIE